MKHNIIAILLSTLALSACAKTTNETHSNSTAQKNDPELQQRIKTLVEKTKKNMIFVQGGTFMMGDFGELVNKGKLPFDGDAHSKPLHKVTLDSYSLNAYKSSYEDLDTYSAATGKPKVMNDPDLQARRYKDAAAGLNWYQARDYCQWLGKQLNVPMDLPTEAQWEYAARNRGQQVVYPTDNGKLEYGKNFNSYEQQQAFTETVAENSIILITQLGAHQPTPLGFYDLINENLEWVADWYAPDYYSKSPEKNPKGPETGTAKVLRSTNINDEYMIRTAFGFTFSRMFMEPKKQNDELSYYNTSVRCAANSPSPIKK
ncbi:formylglycine-generating enzyme family protein [Acinetobacter nematophilus]|uniref:SUMF1/EgtB/PvdO family nonheme iron enzyme n=1 Tax=Acinetobacter nematophilus TaxID=2994642 RepID=A0A9X3DTG2_9GAMM|nr:SUMF1/EgtB/PvdO family nonheme iron enzyme [Acinetobacter nematophilus]MCX5467825.1 SUMF1/EgtB/PvdO family nonheme iron enzyme [Acinetobacter nematophilus]